MHVFFFFFFHNSEIIFFTLFFTFFNLDIFFLALKPLVFIVSSYLVSTTPLTVLSPHPIPHPHQRHIVFGDSSQSWKRGETSVFIRKQILVLSSFCDPVQLDRCSCLYFKLVFKKAPIFKTG